ncbi:cupin domain protein [Hoylesella loescheii DSM 19665 = JCM 12249 = ATCC 15930]|uniref:Cupin domain protein n=2 Tax=Hoylesella loescheii TaxID=840 RepID=A0A069QMY3_HOYLO|nr:cupin domain protein [Hoylesella loescheii DSM 19665 = JCM 12249 = ATCC 15930]
MIMKTVKTTREGKNFTAVNIGKLSEVKDYVLPLGEIEIPGKVFVGQALQVTGCELSFQTLVPGQDSGFLHTHKTHEELYFILKGEGVYQVDGEVFPVSEGSIVRVAPEGKRALKNTGEGEMLMLCIQYKANSFGEDDSPAGDGIILGDKLTW